MGRSSVVFTSALAFAALLACKKSAPTESTPTPQSEPVAAPATPAAPAAPATEAPAPAAAKNFGGTWTTAWGRVTLTQTGSSLTGQYSGQFTGKLDGSVDGSVATLTWTQTNGENGKAKFTLASDGDSFTGTWGSGASATNGGAWNGKRK